MLTSAFRVNCWDPLVTPEIEMDSAPRYLDGISALVPIKALHSYWSYVPGHQIHIPVDVIIPFPLPFRGRASLGLVMVLVTSCIYDLEVPSRGSEITSTFLISLRSCPRKAGAAFIIKEFNVVFILHLNRGAARAEVGFPSHFLACSQWSCI